MNRYYLEPRLSKLILGDIPNLFKHFVTVSLDTTELKYKVC